MANPQEEGKIFETIKKAKKQATGTFISETMSGASISDDIFTKYDITMVSLWATWCSPCIGEMEKLQKVYEQLPTNANLITICQDADKKRNLAKQILDHYDCKFDTIIIDKDINEVFISLIDAFPTTFFIDVQGNILDEPTVGVPYGDVVQAYLDIIHNYLK